MDTAFIKIFAVFNKLVLLQSSELKDYFSNMTFIDYFNAFMVLVIVVGFLIGIGSMMIGKR